MTKFLLKIFCVFIFTFVVSNCKKVENESQSKALKETISFETELKYLQPESCLVEFKNNFSPLGKRSQSIGDFSKPLCVKGEVKNLAIRARVDVDEKSDPGKLAIALVVDSSGSLRSTDPSRKKDLAIHNFLRRLGDSYKEKLDHLKIKLIFTGYCELNSYQKTFSGSSWNEYQSFLKSITFPAIKYQTNFINSLQSAGEFLDGVRSLGYNPNLVLFSDGMPWTKGNFVSGKCPEIVSSLEKDFQMDGKVDLGFDLGGCSDIYGFSKNDGECAEKTSSNGLSNQGLLPELDPINVALSMQQHVDFSKIHLLSKGIKLHSVFLRAGVCWEEANSSGQYRSEFNYLCNNVAKNQLFQMMSGGSGKNILIENASGLDGAFSSLYTGLMKQFELSKATLSSSTGVLEGIVCSQSGGKTDCPLGEKPVTKALSTIGESGNFNIHFPVNIYSLKENAKFKVELDGKPGSESFEIPMHISSDSPSCSDFKEVHSYIEDGYRNSIVTQVTDTLKISCKSRKYLGCVDETGKTILNGGLVGEKNCINYPTCGQNLKIKQICKEGELSPPSLTCPADTKTVEECKPTICEPGEVIPISGKEDQIYTVPGRGDSGSCSGAIQFRCTMLGWQKIEMPTSGCSYSCPANDFVGSSGYENERRTGSGFRSRYSTSCHSEKVETEFICKNGNWIKVDGTGITYPTCKEVSEGCTDYDKCGGKEYGGDSPGSGNASGDGVKSSTIFGKRL